MSGGAYDHQAIERKWQDYWLKNKTFRAEVDPAKPKSYILDMFPYPSGDGLHVGHPEGYTATDILSRHRRMKGFNVLHPMGWDAFGLPAERHAVRTGEHPAVITNRNCDTFRRQLQALGFSYDWDREINTTDPKYYKWTQWIFEILFERGLAYQIEAPVNWCPALGTVLANEEVKDGCYVETGDPVEKRMMRQWMLRITEYAERLLEDLEGLDWPDGIKAMQREWIGRSEGADVTFKVADADLEFTIFTTRPDTLYGATYCVLAPEHPLTLLVTTDDQMQEVEAYVSAAAGRSAQDRMKAERDKTGVFTGAYAVNPVNGERIPIWTADYVLAEYGYGAIMAVPAHDERDLEFAKKFKLPVIQVVRPVRDTARSYLMGADAITDADLEALGVRIADTLENGHRKIEIPKASLPAYEKLITEKLTPGFWNEYLGDETVFLFKHKDGWVERMVLDRDTDGPINKQAHEFNNAEVGVRTTWTWLAENNWYTELVTSVEDGISINSGLITGLPTPEAKKKITAWLEERGIGKGTVNYRLRDWLFSRQRYWGEPFPLVILEDGSVKTVPMKDLPVVLPELAEYKPTEDGRPPLARATDWVRTTDSETGKPAARETNTMPQWAGSCWYYLRFCDPCNDEQAWSTEAEQYWMPIDLYLGGAEHAVLHLLYARFWHKVLFDAGYVHTKEPFQKLFNQGKILAYSFQDAKGKYYYPKQVEKRGEQWFVKGTDTPVHTQIEKMSKSRYNVVNPDDVVREYGADSLRLYEMFMGPLDRDKAWSEEGIQGVYRFLRRVWALFIDERTEELSAKIAEGGGDPASEKALHHAIKHVTEDIENLQFNTAISRLMEFVNTANKADKLDRGWMESFLLILSPFAPHIAEELWARLGHDNTLAYEPWPDFDPALLVEDTVEIPVQINGKLRAVVQVPADADKDAILTAAKAEPKIRSYIDGGKVVKEIVVPGKLVNLVVK